jgi:hypothetical protein
VDARCSNPGKGSPDQRQRIGKVTRHMPIDASAAAALNRRGITTASGKRWHAMQIRRIRGRLGL